MSWITVIWSMIASAILTLALLHLLVWLNQRRQWAHLFFSIAAIAVAVIAGMEFMGMRAASIEQMSTLLRWCHLPFLVIWVAIAFFVRFHFGTGRLWLAWTVCGLRTLALILSFTTGQNLFFREITRLKHVAIFGGETISIPQGVLNPWYVIGPLSTLALIVFVVDASVTHYRRGTDTGRRAFIISGSITLFLLASVAHAALVNTGMINSPYLASLSFMPIIIAMSYELSYDVLRSAQLAQRLQASEAGLRTSEQRMDLAMSAAELALWEWDIVHDEIWSTDKGRTLFGIARTERISFNLFLNSLYAEDREPVRLAVDKSLAGGGDYEGEYRVVLPDEQIRWFATRSHIEFNKLGLPLRMYGVSIDISRRKQAEVDAQKQRYELAHLSRVTMLGELSGALAHQLNQPLAAILSNAQAALRFLAPDAEALNEVRNILEDIVADDKRASDVIQRLRLLLRKDEVQSQPVDVNKVVRKVLKLVHGDLANRNMVANIDLAAQLPAIIGDRVLLQQVLLNLIMNGCEAAAHVEAVEHRQLYIHTLWNGDAVQVSVCDRGRGIAIDDMEHIFEPFFTTKPKGMGLGLSICRTIINAHNGQLWAVNNADCGASFYFTLPSYQGESA
ncbi:MAG: ATP-binding protein [Methylococcales bacterium]|nr:ATP-binding protein [Methylococcales bacterium]